jgi:hypothetical protein
MVSSLDCGRHSGLVEKTPTRPARSVSLLGSNRICLTSDGSAVGLRELTPGPRSLDLEGSPLPWRKSLGRSR